jgi:hypothetical protein
MSTTRVIISHAAVLSLVYSSTVDDPNIATATCTSWWGCPSTDSSTATSEALAAKMHEESTRLLRGNRRAEAERMLLESDRLGATSFAYERQIRLAMLTENLPGAPSGTILARDALSMADICNSDSLAEEVQRVCERVREQREHTHRAQDIWCREVSVLLIGSVCCIAPVVALDREPGTHHGRKRNCGSRAPRWQSTRRHMPVWSCARLWCKTRCLRDRAVLSFSTVVEIDVIVSDSRPM